MQLDMGKAWRDATMMIARNREVMLIVAGVFFFLPSFAATLLMPDLQAQLSQNASPEQAQQFLSDFYLNNAPVFIVMALVQVIGFIALLALLRDDSRPTLGQALKVGLVGLLPYIGVQLLTAFALALLILIVAAAWAGAGTAVGAVLFVAAMVAAAYVLVKLSLVTPVVAIEKVMNPLAVIRRSWTLTKGNSLRLFAYYLLLMAVFFVIMIIVGIVFGVLLAVLGTGTAYLVANGLLSGLLGAAATLVFAAVIAAVHRQLAGPSTSHLADTFE